MEEASSGSLLRFHKGEPPPEIAQNATPSKTTVFGQELTAIRSRRAANFPELYPKAPADQADHITDESCPSVSHDLSGIALSGGGIRSSAFCMGALQALARTPKAKMGKSDSLPQFDYISTVSGGGYTGAALMAAVSGPGYPAPPFPTGGPPFPFGDTNNDEGETAELQHIRDNSRYLLQNKPLRAVASFVAIYLRGLMLSVVALSLPIVAFAMVLAWIAFGISNYAGQSRAARAFSDLVAALLPARLVEALHAAAIRILAALAALRDLAFGAGPENTRFASFGDVLKQIVQLGWLYWIISGVVLLLLAVIVSLVSGTKLRVRNKFTTFVILGLAIVLFVPLFIHLNLWLMKVAALAQDRPAASTGAATSLFASLVGALTKASPFLSAALVAVLPFVKKLIDKSVEALAGGISARLSRVGSRILLTIVALLLPLLLWGLALRLALFLQRRLLAGEPTVSHLSILLCVLFLWITLSLILDTNANSLHQLYRDRLSNTFVRLPLRGNVARRIADNFKLSAVNTRRVPYPIICAALSVPGSHYANKRGRNADFFVMTPQHFGCGPLGYVKTTQVEDIDGLDLGTAMAISGAAVAPNMGLGFSSKLSFTLAFLNVRLGRWMHRPDVLAGWKPELLATFPSLLALWREAFGLSGRAVDSAIGKAKRKRRIGPVLWWRSLANDHILLSDGGHIDNLGVFELLRRRCKFIVAIDAEADPTIHCPSLTQILRLARLDLGLTIDLDPRPIAVSHAGACQHIDQDTPGCPAPPQFHAAAGIINYPQTDSGLAAERGYILYVKASLTGDEYAPVRAYRQRNQTFPHETTGDQMFSEEQYEAYRSLGDHIMRRLIVGQDKPTLPHWLDAGTQAKILPAIMARL